MKSILLTSTALVAFAGAAAADVSFSGEAEFSYNDITGFDSAVEMTATGSVDLDSGYTASASLTFEDSDVVSGGDISLSSDNASITYHIGEDGQEAGYIGEEVGKMSTVDNIFEDASNIDEAAVISASATMGGATISASLDTGETYQIGVSTDLGGTALALGLDEDGTFGAQISGDASGFSYAIAMGDSDQYGLSASTTAGGADLTVDFGDDGWEIGAEMPLGDATVGVTFDDAQDWEVSLSTALDAVSLGMTFDQDSDWELTAGVEQSGLAADITFDSDDNVEVLASYAIMDDVMAYVGYVDGANEVTYVGVEYDLGGATVVLSNASSDDAEDEEIGQEYVEGTTISVSFSF